MKTKCNTIEDRMDNGEKMKFIALQITIYCFIVEWLKIEIIKQKGYLWEQSKIKVISFLYILSYYCKRIT